MNFQHWILIVGASLGIHGCSPSAPAGSSTAAVDPLVVALRAPTPENVREAVESHGAAATWPALDQGDGATPMQMVLANVESGDPAWLAVVPLLRPGADGANDQSLMIATSRALLENPSGVLALTSLGGVEAAEVCRSREIEATTEDRAIFKASAISAVAAVSMPGLQAEKQTCLAELEKHG